ncbi:MAG TPA: DUF4240 domain-containing protein [Kofleriaceae bacterium]|jgi:hypothetical protein
MARISRPSTKKPRATPKRRSPARAKPAKPAPLLAGDDRWWALIGKPEHRDSEEQADRLVAALGTLPLDDILAFDTFVNERIRDAFHTDLWAVAYIMNGGCSDDGFDYFLGWLVLRGKEAYEAALANPEHAAKGVSPDDGPFENEAVWYAARTAYEEKAGEGTFDAKATRVVRSLKGEMFDEDTVDERYPKLARRFGG